MPNFGNTIHLFGGRGAHGKDLIAKGVLPYTSISMEVNDPFPRSPTHGAVTIPIGKTRILIDTLIEQNPQIQLVNFAGIMAPTLSHDMRNSVGSFHALWGPKTQSNFRIVHATDGVNDELSRYLIERIHKQGMDIIDRTRNEHDEQMALHQALTHAAIILHDSTPGVAKISPITLPQTISDMIIHNPYFLGVWNEFIGHINSGKSLGEAYRLCMGEADMELSTPNSENQIRNSQDWNTTPTEDILTRLGRAIQAQDGHSTKTLIDVSRMD